MGMDSKFETSRMDWVDYLIQIGKDTRCKFEDVHFPKRNFLPFLLDRH